MSTCVNNLFREAVLNKDAQQARHILTYKSFNFNIDEVIQGKSITPLHAAIGKKDVYMVKLLLKNGANMQLKSDDGDNCLHLAIKSGKVELIKLFLDKRVRINEQNSDGLTALHMAIQYEDIATIKLLLRSGADPNLKNNAGYSAFHKIFDWLCDNELLNLFLKHAANVNHRNNLGENSLHIAVLCKEYKAIPKLLKAGVDVNAWTNEKKSALHLLLQEYKKSSNKKVLSVISLLVKHNADIDVVDGFDNTLLYYAFLWGQLDLVEYFLRLGADVNGSRNHNIILNAVQNVDLKRMQYLIGHGLKVNLKNNDKDSLLHISINSLKTQQKCYEIIKLLLDNGANIDDRDKHGYAPIQLALEKYDLKLFELLIERGAAINVKNNEQESLLYQVVDRDLYGTAKTLLGKGANVNDRNVVGKSILTVAISKDSEKMVELLLNNGAYVKDDEVWEEAAELVNFRIIKLLESSGVVIEPNSWVSRRMFINAIKSSKPDVVKYLLDKGIRVNSEFENVGLLSLVLTYFNDNKLESKVIVEILVEHIALLAVQGLRVDEENMMLMQSKQWMFDYYSDCYKTFEEMNTTKVCVNYKTTYLDILVKRHNSLAYCLKCDEVIDKLESGVYKRMFDKYSDKLEHNFSTGLRRLRKMEEFETILIDIFGGILQFDVICKLSGYYNDKDFTACLRN